MIDYNKVNQYYFNIYLNAFKKAKEKIPLLKWNTLYDGWLYEVDAELEKDLVKDNFIQILLECIKSFLDLRAIYRKLGIPVESLEHMVYNFKKIYLESLSLIYLHKNFYFTQHDIIFQKGKVRLLHYKIKDTNKSIRIPILIVYGQINKYNIMDISFERSVIRNLQSNGFDVYLIDWGYERNKDDNNSLNDYVKELKQVVHIILKENNVDKISLIGYCWGGVISLIYATLYKHNTNCLVLLATPIDFSKDKTLLSTWAKNMEIEESIIREYGHLDGSFLDIAFIMRNPHRSLYNKYFNVKNFENINLLSNFLAVEKWLYDTRPIPGIYYKEIIDNFYKKNLLISNRLEINRKTVNLREFDIPVLYAVAQKDDLVSPESTIALSKYISSDEKKIVEIPGGHVGLIIGSNAHKKVWPEIYDWIKKINTR